MGGGGGAGESQPGKNGTGRGGGLCYVGVADPVGEPGAVGVETEEDLRLKMVKLLCFLKEHVTTMFGTNPIC